MKGGQEGVDVASSNFYGSFFFLLPPSLGSPGSGWRPAGEPPEEGLSKWPRNVCLCGRCLSPTPAVLSASFTLPPTEEQSEGSNRASPQRAWHGRVQLCPHMTVWAPLQACFRESLGSILVEESYIPPAVVSTDSAPTLSGLVGSSGSGVMSRSHRWWVELGVQILS